MATSILIKTKNFILVYGGLCSTVKPDFMLVKVHHIITWIYNLSSVHQMFHTTISGLSAKSL
jgi:hypothetical protein